MKKLKDILGKLKGMDRSQWIVVILTGVLLLVVAIPLETPKKHEKSTETAEENGESGQSSTYQRRMETQLEETLMQMEGVGEVKVMLTLRDGGEQILAKDLTKSDKSATQADGSVTSESSSESATVYDGEEDPVATKSIMPDIEGILVVAEGAGNSRVENSIYRSVMALFPVDAHKISVVKMKGQE